ncbi:MAG: hypothetical protein ACT4PM_02475 [Gemmatimonadales bacterium]
MAREDNSPTAAVFRSLADVPAIGVKRGDELVLEPEHPTPLVLTRQLNLDRKLLLSMIEAEKLICINAGNGSAISWLYYPPLQLVR